MQLISTMMDTLPFQNQFSQEGKCSLLFYTVLLSQMVYYYDVTVHQA